MPWRGSVGDRLETSASQDRFLPGTPLLYNFSRFVAIAPQPASGGKTLTDQSEQWRRTNVGRLLNNALTQFEDRVVELLAEAGQSEVRVSHIGLTRSLDRRGTRVTELARRANMTKQGMSELISQCEAIGLVQRTVDPEDRRAKIVRFTDRGLEWLTAFEAAVQQAEFEMRTSLGTLCVDGLCSALTRYIEHSEPVAAGEPDTP
ncbi:MAG TPA: MarR family transcriptional regulator [Nitrospira sp.]|nr:MarR family transcriptional regulator [Nitrospira sp.]